jgi:hypothetical protein
MQINTSRYSLQVSYKAHRSSMWAPQTALQMSIQHSDASQNFSSETLVSENGWKFSSFQMHSLLSNCFIPHVSRLSLRWILLVTVIKFCYTILKVTTFLFSLSSIFFSHAALADGTRITFLGGIRKKEDLVRSAIYRYILHQWEVNEYYIISVWNC